MIRRWVQFAVLLFVGAVPGVQGDVILDWTALLIDGIRTDNSAPTLSTRNLAILHTAIYDAVNSIVRSHQRFRFQLDAPEDASPEAAAVAAAYEVTKVLYPPLRPRTDELYESFVAGAAPGEALTRGLELGRKIGVLTLDSRAADGANTDVPYIPSAAPGQWRRTPPFFRPPTTPNWGRVKPFCLPATGPFLPGPPPALTSAAYAESVNEVRRLGAKQSTARTAEQGQIATFWSDFSYTAMPPGHWHVIAAAIARTQSNSLAANARLFALLSVAQMDAGIVCWEAKYRYNMWRPITAIRQADRDENPATEKDEAWDNFLNSPPFPAFPSGHSTFSKASARVLTHFYGTDALAFTAVSDSLPGIYRKFTSLAQCADEVGMSRIYGGIHFSFDNEEGKAAGQKVADFITANFLLPNDALPLFRVEGGLDGRLQLRVHGHPDATCVVQVSTNRSDWTPLATVKAIVGGAVTPGAVGVATGPQYYRVVETR